MTVTPIPPPTGRGIARRTNTALCPTTRPAPVQVDPDRAARRTAYAMLWSALAGAAILAGGVLTWQLLGPAAGTLTATRLLVFCAAGGALAGAGLIGGVATLPPKRTPDA